MKLSSALTILLALLRHGTCASDDGDGDHNHRKHRKLLLNQTEAAYRIDSIVKMSKLAVEEGNVRGLVLPLNYVLLSYGNQQLTVALRLPGVDRDQHVLVDTGSSSLAFCDKSLAEEAVNITKTMYSQCNTYSGGYDSYCPDNPAPLFNEFYVGQMYKGPIAAYDVLNGKELASMDDANFAIMERVQDYICNSPLDGIIGVAYSNLNFAYVTPSLDYNAMNMWNQSCVVNGESLGTCNPAANMTATALLSPLEQALKEDAESGYDSVEAFGLYCDYAATIGSKDNTIIPSLGIYFGGDLAVKNYYYNNGKPQVSNLLLLLFAALLTTVLLTLRLSGCLYTVC